MSVSATVNRVTFAGNGTTTSFSFPYYIMAATDLNVFLTDAFGNITAQTLNSAWTWSGTAISNGTYPSGGNVVFGTAPASGYTVTIARNVPETQPATWVDGDPDPSLTKSTAFDRATLQIQRLQDLLNRAIVMQDGAVDDINLELPTPVVPNAAIVINPEGTGLVFALGYAGPYRAGGAVAIPQNATGVSVTFSSSLGTTNYGILTTMGNLTDTDPDFQPVTYTAKSATGFTVVWNDPTPTANYLLDWAAIQNL